MCLLAAAAAAAAASDADGSAVVSLEHRRGWAHSHTGGGRGRYECAPGCLEMTSLIALWQRVGRNVMYRCNLKL